MFEHLSAYPRIVVTGPQRSGTTIAANMIACDTGHKLVDEIDYGVYDVERWKAQLVDHGVVVQCPVMLRQIVDDGDPGLFVLLMRRPLAEIHASRDRIDWWIHEPTMLAIFDEVDGDSAQIAYDYWDDHPKPPHFVEIEYHSLAGHPMWVDDRTGFTSKQIA